MRIISNIVQATRVLFSLGAQNPSDGTRWVEYGGGFGRPGQTFEENLRNMVVAYFACRRNIAEDMALMPFRILKSEGRMRIAQPQDPLSKLLNLAPNPSMSAFSFRSTIIGHMLDTGTGFAHIQWNRMTGKPVALWPVHPSRIRTTVRAMPNGLYELEYWIMNRNGSETGPIPQSDMLKIPGFSDDGVIGFSMFKVLMNSLATAWSTQNVTKNFFEHNATPGGILESTQNVGKEERQALMEHWAEHHEGPQNAGKVLVLGSGLTYKILAQNFKDADLVNLRQLTIQDIATGFRMPLRKLQVILNAQGWSTVDAQEADYTMSCLQPNATRFEQEIQRQLMGEEHGYTEADQAHFEMKGRLRGDLKSRMEYYKALFFMGCITPNEIRALEDMNPILTPAGVDNPMDKTYIQGATVPLEMAGMLQKAGVSVDPPEQEDEEQKQTNEEMQSRLSRIENVLAVRN